MLHVRAMLLMQQIVHDVVPGQQASIARAVVGLADNHLKVDSAQLRTRAGHDIATESTN